MGCDLYSELFKSFGSLNGGCPVWGVGEDRIERGIAFIAPYNGPRIAAAPAVLMAQKLVNTDFTQRGAFPCVGYISTEEFDNYLQKFDIWVSYKDDSGWTELSA